jgi:hypothetical protein
VKLGILFAILFAGCGLTAADGQHFSDLSSKLAACRKEATDAKDGGATTTAATMKYEDCKRREGVEGEQ